MAERQGFEPWDAHTSTVFKTAAIDHSATSPFCGKPCVFPGFRDFKPLALIIGIPIERTNLSHILIQDIRDIRVPISEYGYRGICQLTSRAHGINLGRVRNGGRVSHP